jgi:hypothetical protein
MKNFNSLINELVGINEQPEPGVPPAAPPPDPNAGAAPSPAPGAGEQADASPQANLSPAAEVTLVRLLLKALVINIEDSDLSTLTKIDQPEINQENAEQVKQDILSIINSQQTRGENEDRIETVHDTMNSINENNRKGMLNKFVQLMKKYSDVNIET